MTPEGKIVKHAKKRSKDLGLRCLRVSMRQGVEVGWPDLFIFGPNRNLLGMETKRNGQPASPMQEKRGKEMISFGFAWCKPDSKEEVDYALINFALRCTGQPPMTWDQMKEAIKEHDNAV